MSAKKVGKFQVTATKGGKSITADVTIEPYQNFFKEPLMLFGKTKADIKTSETRELVKEVSKSLVYEGENSYVSKIFYLFDDNGVMTSAIAMFPTGYDSNDRVATFYKERYTVLGVENNIIALKNLDKPIYMYMRYTTYGLNVVYTKK